MKIFQATHTDNKRSLAKYLDCPRLVLASFERSVHLRAKYWTNHHFRASCSYFRWKVKFGEPNENFSTEKFMHFEPSALYQSKWEEDKLGATSSETHNHTDKSDKALWSVSNQTDCKYFERITLSKFISSTLVCFKHHSAKCFYVANVQSPLKEFQLECKYSQSEYNHFGSCQFWPTSNFVSATRICHSKLQLFCASCEGLVLSVATEQTEPGNSFIVFGRFLQNISKEQ